MTTRLRRATGLVAVVTGGYAATAVTGGFGLTFGEPVLLAAGVVVAGYGIATLVGVSDRLVAWNGPATLLVGSTLAAVQWSVEPSGGFAGDELWNANWGTATGLYLLAGSLVVLGAATALSDRRTDES